MSNDYTSKEKIWAYVHGEFDDAEKRAFERAMQDDAKLEEDVKLIQVVDTRLRQLLTLAQGTEEELEERILQELEKTQAVEAEPSPSFLDFLSDLAGRWISPAPVLRLAVVAVTCVLAAVGLYNFLGDSIAWQAGEICAVPAYRGDEAPPAPIYDREELVAFASDLQVRIQRTYDEEAPPRSTWKRLTGQRQWILTTHIQTLPTGRILVDVEVMDRAGKRPVGQWSQHFEGPTAPDGVRDAFSRDVAHGLSALTQRGEQMDE